MIFGLFKTMYFFILHFEVRNLGSKQLQEIIQLQTSKKNRLGQLLLQKGLIVNNQLETALKEQYWRKNGFWVID